MSKRKTPAKKEYPVTVAECMALLKSIFEHADSVMRNSEHALMVSLVARFDKFPAKDLQLATAMSSLGRVLKQEENSDYDFSDISEALMEGQEDSCNTKGFI